jgi:hypothetical protein
MTTAPPQPAPQTPARRLQNNHDCAATTGHLCTARCATSAAHLHLAPSGVHSVRGCGCSADGTVSEVRARASGSVPGTLHQSARIAAVHRPSA